MKFWWLLFLVVFHIWLNTGHCAAIGQDFCHCQLSLIGTPKISIPRMVNSMSCTQIPGPQIFTPIKDACSCVKVRVAPGSIARDDEPGSTATTTWRCSDRGGGCGGDAEPRQFGEPGSAFSPASACNTGGVTQSGNPVVQEPPGPDGIDEPATDSAGNGCCAGGSPVQVAVDPVSLILAQAEANRCRGDVREDRLAFGQVAVPRDAMPPRPAAAVSDVDEEGLYALDKAIVELKTCKRFGKTAVLASDTDALLALEDDAQLDDTNNSAGPEVTLPSYADVGYRAETPSCAPLIGGVSVADPGTK